MSKYTYPLTGQDSTVNVYPVQLVKVEQMNIEKENIGPRSKSILRNSLNNWSKALNKGMGEKLSLALKLVGLEEKSHQIVFNNDGLINQFAKLRSIEDIESFSKKYGLLGIEPPDNEQIKSSYYSHPSFIFNKYGSSLFEPIQLWHWHINEIHQILKLYDIVKKNSSDDSVSHLIEIKMHTGMFGSLAEDRSVTDRYFVHWTTGEPILMLPEDLEEKPLLEIGQYTLSKVLASHLYGGVHLGTGDIIRNSSTKGFKVLERRYTNSLLAAIYYDLWQKINNDMNIYICGNKSCGSPFIKAGRKKFCSDACKQEAYRDRLKRRKVRDE
ncbi:hypothetical protein [Fictibacillus barbaricus]|uniref:CGNR zinc finger domain-containing protein n=1 Tax=Fictibacillus barbaricus TaxID=182136 RepID=A0ABS2ZB97_9BACL|nr:hypothetical protein [Fictibacillus barbaricus]MBN3543911.1 hypothetical protein [Fictibacillus barbaricus]GGB71656.1 hypothetical protein GCM10007199_42340 [Fictibacillus barbaricus]